MAKEKLPLSEVSIEELFSGSEKSVYEIPIYQRNYAWENDEIQALVQDVYDAYKKDAGKPYYIGTLVSYHKGDSVYEIIDGQQRLTTIRLLLDAMEVPYTNKLTYRARKKSDDTLRSIPKFDIEEKDSGIVNGFKYAKAAIDDIRANKDISGFTAYFRNNVHIIHYKVPKDIDLNHYFEIMNSRGEQLEKHEIVKANLMEKLDTDEERRVFNRIWECCSEMSVYTQQNLSDFDADKVFGRTLYEFLPQSFDELIIKYRESKKANEDSLGTLTIGEIIRGGGGRDWEKKDEIERKDSFQPIIDFPNFLLIVLKIARMAESGFDPVSFTLDDKELLNEFYKAKMDAGKVRKFAFLLLKAKFLLDNYVVHHSKEEDTIDSNPWKLQVWHKDEDTKKGQLKNLTEEKALQDRLAHILSMFEVSFTARQRKNYLFYCMFYLMGEQVINVADYARFAEKLAEAYFYKVYLDGSKLNAINTPLPGSFDSEMLDGNHLNTRFAPVDVTQSFNEAYGDGTLASRGVPLFIFNYLDFKLWSLYDEEMRGEQLKENSRERREFFDKLGCNDFGLKVFDQFYFSRTRRSLEHYYPQANATGEAGALDQNQINCLGNYAMIGSDANSSGSNWSPKTKLDHYLDSSGKISQISVASLKFMIMMQKCKDNDVSGKMEAWDFEDIKDHQSKMLSILVGGSNYLESEANSGNELSHEAGTAIDAVDQSSRVIALATSWLREKEEAGELHISNEKSDERYIRFTTDSVTSIIPDAQEAKSGWGTSNHYFFEVHNYAGKKICMQLALSGKNIPDNLSIICDRINDFFPVKRTGKRWMWRLPFCTAKAKITEEMSDEEIIEIVSRQYYELKQFEAKLIEAMA